MKNSFIRYLLRSGVTRGQIILFVVFILLTIILFITNPTYPLDNMWKILEPILGLGTLSVAIFIWLNEKKQEWESNLPKKLNVIYDLHGKEYAKVINAPLASEQDIRQWGLSIAQTIMNNTLRIEFSGFNLKGPRRNKIEKGKYTMLYEITYYLTKEIEGLDDDMKNLVFNDEGNLIRDIKEKNSAHSV